MNIKPIETRYDGCRFRSRTEARWAVFFNAVGLEYEYEKEGYALPSGWYLPDFYLPDIGYWLEVKGQAPTPDEISAGSFLHFTTGKPVLIAVGAPRAKPQILRLPLLMSEEESERGAGSLDLRYYFADDRRNAGELWLASDEYECFSIGPVVGPDHGKLPCVHSATAAAYEAARSARFERGAA
jgi:hypothetical protein